MQALKVLSTKDLSREDWLEQRRKGIGGSDASAIVGLNRYTSAFQVYCDKAGLLPEQEDNEAMRQGRDFEDYVAKRFEEQTGKQVKKCNFMLAHPDHPFLTANIDRMVAKEKAGLECKTTSVYNKTDFESGDIPPQYYVQCQHYMMVTGFPLWYVAVLVLNKGFHVIEVKRNEGDIAALMEAEITFWREHVEKQIPPSPDQSERAAEVLQKIYPKADDSKTVISLYHKEAEIRRLLQVKAELKELEDEKTLLENILKAELKDTEGGCADKYFIKWHNRSKNSVDSKKLQADHPEIYEKYLKKSEYRTFIVGEC